MYVHNTGLDNLVLFFTKIFNDKVRDFWGRVAAFQQLIDYLDVQA
jgi:hypothetical protein